MEITINIMTMIKRMKLMVLFAIPIVVSCQQKKNNITESSSAKNQSGSVQTITSDTIEIRDEQSFYFEYDNSDHNKFGVEFFDHDEPVGEHCVVVDEGVIYILDTYHNNVKKFNLSTQELSSSQKLSNKRIWLYDMMIFKERLYVSSELDSIYIFDKNLTLLKKSFVKEGRASFVKEESDETLLLHYPDSKEYITMNQDLLIMDEIKVPLGQRGNTPFYNGRFIKRLGEFLYQTDFGILKKENVNLFFPNSDFDSNKLAAVKQDSSNLILTIYLFDPS